MEDALNTLLQALRRYQPQRVILFGSAARGEADADSDLDVLVIKDTPEPFVQRLEAMARLCPAGVHADIVVYTPDELQRMVEDGNPFILRALEEGKVIYEAGS
ncbi:MAG TPA: nucleotidyltransferase domain-containing protein [Alphaproteobacteria bacterium]|nr:nucleotidyltransferase domain-containing protein [Alphaproteobacteria bacterium]